MDNLFLLFAVVAAYLVFEVIRSIIKIITLITKIFISIAMIGLVLFVLNFSKESNNGKATERFEPLMADTVNALALPNETRHAP